MVHCEILFMTMNETISLSGELLETKIPVVLHGLVKWNQLKWTLNDWESKLTTVDIKYPVRKGSNNCSKQPKWERTCHIEQLTMREFFEILQNNEYKELDEWFYFDYKHIAQWFQDNISLKDISWDCIGFPDKSAKDSTIWIGTKRAHTPCHADSYGCNVVAQIYGRKMWILFPPEETENLKPRRIPYEESSVYSGINFACGCGDMSSLKEAKMVILEPGDLLYVPKGWWHYVENLSPAISINMWIPLESDNESRLEESLAKCLVTSLIHDVTPEEKLKLLNPNEDDIDSVISLDEVGWCLRQCKPNYSHDSSKMVKSLVFSEQIQPVDSVDIEELRKIIKRKCKSPIQQTSKDKYQESSLKLEDIINAVCHPDVITSIRMKLQSNIHKKHNF